MPDDLDDLDHHDDEDEGASGAYIPIPTETFLEELSVKLQIHPISIYWLLEELRVGLFAQELKTPMPVSVKRLQKIWDSRPR